MRYNAQRDQIEISVRELCDMALSRGSIDSRRSHGILYDRASREQSDAIASDRRQQVGTGDRSERIRTDNYRENRVSDHRIGLTLYSLDSFLDGDIDGMIDALATAHTAEKLKQQS